MELIEKKYFLFRYDLHIMLYALERKEGKPGELE
jgi:hypothetical protein